MTGGGAVRLAAIYDVHGNLPALEAVLDEIRGAGVDEIVVGGDVFPGPMDGESLRCLLDLELPVRFIRGNGESAVLSIRSGRGVDQLPEQARAAVRWSAERLDAEHERVLASWPSTLRVDVEGLGAVLFCHATPRSDTELFTRITPEDRLLPIFGALEERFVVCGHTHMPFDRRIGGTRVVNAGSVGMPFGRPGADWLLLGSDVEPRHTDYDLAAAAQRIETTAYPSAVDFAARHVLHPPSEQEMLDIFSKAHRG